MQKISLLSIFLLLCVMTSTAQLVTNADKNYVSTQKNTAVSISAEAILNGKPNDNKINSENYHRAVSAGNEAQQKIATPTVVEIEIAAQQSDMSSENTVIKEIIQVQTQNPVSINRTMPTIINITVPATKQ